ncbi:MAG: succinate dehydrogenase cytochrome b subunit [Bacillota bacterium]
MHLIAEFYRSTPGKKSVIAVTGIILFTCVLFHLLGNLQIFLGPEKFNSYARLLHAAPGFLWAVRFVLFAAAFLHVITAVGVTLRNRGARPAGYAAVRYREADYAARTMIWSGMFIAVFTAYHVLHFTTGTIHPDFIRGDVYHNVTAGLRVPAVSVFYFAASVLLGLHLYHGLWSVFQTVGLSHPLYDPWRRAFATFFSLVIVAGNVSILVAALLRPFS